MRKLRALLLLVLLTPAFSRISPHHPRRAPGRGPSAPRPPVPGSQPALPPLGSLGTRPEPRGAASPPGRPRHAPSRLEPGSGRQSSPGKGSDGQLGGGVGGGGGGRLREEDAAPLRCHRRVAGKQLVPAPFRPAPLATRNTMHNNQARAWSCATRRGRGGAAGGPGGAQVATLDRRPVAAGGPGPCAAPRGQSAPREVAQRPGVPPPRPARLPLPPRLRAPYKVHSH